MAYLNISIPIPDKRITYKKTKNPKVRYVYAVLKKRRNANGTPTNDEVSIGKEDMDNPGFMIPNTNYEKYYKLPYNITPLNKPKKVVSNGATSLLKMLSDDLGLSKVLEDTFRDDYLDILHCAMYMCLNSNVMMNVDYFFDEYSNKHVSMSSQKISKLFATITHEKIIEFFKRWNEIVTKEDKTLAYDVTSISTYANHHLANWGYNRDKDNLPQINLGMLYGTTTNLPVAYSVYSGSIPDCTFFSYSLKLSDEIGVENSLYILDRGFYTKNNLEIVKNMNVKMLVGVSKSQTIFKTAMNEVKDTIRHSKNHISDAMVYGVKRAIEINGSSYTLYIYYNSKSVYKEEQSIYEHIQRLENELQKKSKFNKKQRYKNYYDIEFAKEGLVKDYKINHDKITKSMNLLGMFALLSNTDEYSPQQALEMYSRRDTIEKAFDSMKNELSSKRVLTHNATTTNAKIFSLFLSLILYSKIKNIIRQNKDLEKTTQRLLLAMQKIKTISYEKGNSLLEPLTKKQKDILKAFRINEDEFVREVVR